MKGVTGGEGAWRGNKGLIWGFRKSGHFSVRPVAGSLFS